MTKMMNSRTQAAAGLLAAALALPMAAFGGGLERAWIEAGTFDARISQGLGTLRDRSKDLAKPEKPRPPLPKTAFGGLDECSVANARFFKQPALQEAVKMLAPCMAAVSKRYGVMVSAASGLLSKPGWRGGVPGIKILVSGELPAGSRVMDDLSFTVDTLHQGILLTYAAKVEYLGVIRPLGSQEQQAKASSLQGVVDSCTMAALVGPIKKSKDFVKAYEECLMAAPGFKITAVQPPPPFDEQMFGLHVWIFSKADAAAIDAMNGDLMVPGSGGPTRLMVKAYFDAKIAP